jgi:hypothetical protein
MTDPKPPESDIERARRFLDAQIGARDLCWEGSLDEDDYDALAAEFAAVRAEARRAAILECATWLENVYRSRAVADDMRNAILSPSTKTEETKA